MVSEQALKRKLIQAMKIGEPGPYHSLVSWFKALSSTNSTKRGCNEGKNSHFHLEERVVERGIYQWRRHNGCLVLQLGISEINPKWHGVDLIGEMSVTREVLAGVQTYKGALLSDTKKELSEELVQENVRNALIKAKTVRGLLDHLSGGRVAQISKPYGHIPGEKGVDLHAFLLELNELTEVVCGQSLSHRESTQRNQILGYIAVITSCPARNAQALIADEERRRWVRYVQ